MPRKPTPVVGRDKAGIIRAACFGRPGTPEYVSTMQIVAAKPTFRLEFKVNGKEDWHKCYNLAEAAELAEETHERLKAGVLPAIGKQAEARNAVDAPAIPKQRVFMTLPDLQALYEKDYGSSKQSLASAVRNLRDYVYPPMPVIDPRTGRPTGVMLEMARIDLRDFTESHIVRWIKAAQHFPKRHGSGTLSDSTVALSLRNLSALFEYGVKKGYLPENPCGHGKTKVKVNVRSTRNGGSFKDEAEFMRILPYLAEWSVVPLTAIVYTGARFGEARGLQRMTFDMENRRIYFTRQILSDGSEAPLKTKASQDWVPMLDPLVPFIQKWLDAMDDQSPEAPLFTGQRGGRFLENSSLNRQLQKACKAAGIQRRITVHGLRRSFATWLHRLGVPLDTISELLRHADIRTTRGYIDISEDDKFAAVNVLLGKAL
jgi:integrase